MQARMKNPAMVLDGVVDSVQGLVKAAHSAGVPRATLELAHLRVSQLNGCSACVRGAMPAGTDREADERMWMVSAWKEAPCFDDAERAALSLAESMTRLADRTGEAVPDDVFDAAARHYDERQLAALILWIATANLFNRINATIRHPAGEAFF